jgi:hypothetical protein
LQKNEILEKEVFFQLGVQASRGENIPLRLALAFIKERSYSAKISQIRALFREGNDRTANEIKKTLPAAVFAASYIDRRVSGSEKNYNGLCVFDIDHICSGQLSEYHRALCGDKFVFSIWLSPSGNGLKGLVPFRSETPMGDAPIQSFHRAGFNLLREYFQKEYMINIDESGKDISRLCFLSDDPFLHMKDSVEGFLVSKEIFDIDATPIRACRKYLKEVAIGINEPNPCWQNPYKKNDPRDRKRISSIMKFLSKRCLSITTSYDDWYHVAYALANTFTYEIGLKYFLKLSQMDADKYTQKDCVRQFNYCFANSQNRIAFSTVVYYAQNQGYHVGGRVAGRIRAY